MVELIISEKPKSAQRIAEALADGKPIKKKEKGVTYYEITRGDKDIIVASSVGHLFGVAEKEKKGLRYPTFDVEWKPLYEISKDAAFSKKYYDIIKKLAKKVDSFVIGSDLDTEGEVIGLNILRYICKQKDAKRMKFSTLTKDDLIKAYENASPTIEWGLAIAGETRHNLDFYYGINLSRALIASIKKAGMFKILSIGRVQGPALKIIVDKERDIAAFKPKPFWQIEMTGSVKKGKLAALHREGKFWDKKKAEKAYANAKGKDGKVSDARKQEFEQPAPPPFDLTTLQTEAYRCFGINPKITLSIAQDLYTSGLISYPRTSSQQLPEGIGYANILKQLQKNKDYESLCSELLKKTLKPNNGKKTDPAHPAIYPTGILSRGLENLRQKIYDIIVRRFMATFAEAAVRETATIEIDINGEIFIASGTRTKKEGWHRFYGTYAKMKEEELPAVDKGEVFRQESLNILEKETKPPARYTQASIIRELEKRNLGTKCLTGDCSLVTPTSEEVTLNQLWEQSIPMGGHENVEIRKLNTPTAVSMNEQSQRIEFTKPTLISRRNLEKGEKLLEIATQGGSIKATDDHLTYIYRDDKIATVPSSKIAKGDRMVSIITRGRTGGTIVTEDWFTKPNYNLINGVYKHRYASTKALGVAKEKLPISWSPEIAWILGYFYGDGSYSAQKYNGSHQIYFTTTEKKALALLQARIIKIFGCEPKAYIVKDGRVYKVQCNGAVSTLLATTLPALQVKERFNIPEKFMGDFLRGLFDADGNIHLRSLGKVKIKGAEAVGHGVPRVKLTLANEALIRWVEEMLQHLGIEGKVHTDKAKLNGKLYPCFTIRIGGRDNVDRFAWKVGFDVVYKNNLLYRGLMSASLQYKRLAVGYAAVRALKNQEWDAKKLKTATGYSNYDIRMTMRRLVKLQVVKRKRLSSYATPPNRTTYELVDKDYYLHSLRAAYEMIGSDLYAAKVTNIKDVTSKNVFVFDLSVLEDAPNFVTSGSILVHNSTRAEIVDTLYKRGYVNDKAIKATDLGIKIEETLQKHVPEVVDEELTRHFEVEMDEVMENKKKEEDVLKEAQEVLTGILSSFKKKEATLGAELVEATKSSEIKENTVGKCTNCSDGTLMIKFGKFGRFIACSRYPECKTTFKLPAGGMVKVTEELCSSCNHPKITMIRKRKQPQDVCINLDCPEKKLNSDKENTKCEKCGKGKMVIRKSVYGQFLACDQFPKCRNVMKIQ